MIQPEAAVRNFARLSHAGAGGRYGFREALDYTPRRLPEGESVAIVKSYMAHHQGMALVALGNVLNDRAMVERFHADPLIEATELLLQERMPRDVLVARPRSEEVKSAADVRDLVPPVLRRFTSPHDVIPRTHVLSNGRYAVMVTAAGSGYSRWRDIAVTRWREDVPAIRGAAILPAGMPDRRGGRQATSPAARKDGHGSLPGTTPSFRRDGSMATA
jgi:cyclic beta-1,2-glucan synthetase